jgi:preprotein translocase subunit SecD
MKKITNLLFIAGAIAMLATGCKGKDKVANDPKAVVMAFFEKMSKKDIDGAAKLATKDSKSTMDMMKKGMDMAEKMKDSMKDAKAKDDTEGFKDVEFGETKVDGDNATVSITNKKKEHTMDFPLKKEGGDWKVDFTMGTLMKMGMDQMKKSGNENPFENKGNGTDTSGSMKDLEKLMNSDTLKAGLEKAKEMLEKIKPEDLEKAKEMMKNLEKMKTN